jgi:hypothetical protein
MELLTATVDNAPGAAIVVAAGVFGATDETPLKQAVDAMHRITRQVAEQQGHVLLDFRQLRGRCFAAEFELAAQLSTWRVPPGRRVAVVDHASNARLWRRWERIALEQRRYVEFHEDGGRALAWLSE